MNVAQVLERHPVGRFAFFSSGAVYGEDTENLHITESTAVRTSSLYGLGKHVSEQLFLKVINPTQGSSLLIVRPPLIYGPGDHSYGYGPCGFIRAACRNERIVLWGQGEEKRDFVFIEDAVNAVLRLIASDCHGPVNLASGVSHSFADVIGIVSKLVHGAVDVASQPRTKPKVDQGFSIDRLQELAPGMSFTSLEEGMRQTFEAERAVVGA